MYNINPNYNPTPNNYNYYRKPLPVQGIPPIGVMNQGGGITQSNINGPPRKPRNPNMAYYQPPQMNWTRQNVNPWMARRTANPNNMVRQYWRNPYGV